MLLVIPSMRVAVLPHGTQEGNPDCIPRNFDLRYRNGACLGLARTRRASPLAPTPGAHHTPGLPALSPSRTSSHAPLYSYSRIPTDSCRSLPSDWRGVSGSQGTIESAFPEGLALRPEVRFAWSWVGPPVNLERCVVTSWKVYASIKQRTTQMTNFMRRCQGGEGAGGGGQGEFV